MHKLILVLAATLFASAGYGADASAEAGASEAKPATVVVYRSDADLRSRRLAFDVRLDQQGMGRIRRDGALVIEQAPGEYTLDTSLPGDERLTLILQPGLTYYVEASLRVRGDLLEVSLQEVGEQVARTRAQLPDGQI
jgi:hypothetical protein